MNTFNFLGHEITLTDQLMSRVRKENSKVLFFRVLGPYLQKLYSDYYCEDSIPRVLIHGNPHLDNYSKTFSGCGLGDYDRCRLGPFSWDIIRAVGSIDFWGAEKNNQEIWLTDFYQGYSEGLLNSLVYWDTPEILRSTKPEKWQLTPKKYFKSNEKWSKKVRKNLVPLDNIEMRDLFSQWMEQNPHLNYLSSYELIEQAKVLGSMGKAHYVYVLNKGDSYLYYDIKETYVEEDDVFFTNPFPSQGERMISGSNLFSPGMELRMSSVQFNGNDYWGREIPILSTKLPKSLTSDDQAEIARNIGVQLGRGHRQGNETTNIQTYFEEKFEYMVDLSLLMNREIEKNYQLII